MTTPARLPIPPNKIRAEPTQRKWRHPPILNKSSLELICHTHAEGPGAVEGLVGLAESVHALGGADEAVVVVAFEEETPSGSHAEFEAEAASQAGVEAVVGEGVIFGLHEMISVAGPGALIAGDVDIALTPLSSPETSIAASHEMDADSLAAEGEVGHDGELEVEVLVIGGVGTLKVEILDIEVGAVVLGHHLDAGTDAEPLVELIAETSFEVDAATGEVFAVPEGELGIESVAGAAEHQAEIEAVVVEGVLSDGGLFDSLVLSGIAISGHLYNPCLLFASLAVVVCINGVVVHKLAVLVIHRHDLADLAGHLASLSLVMVAAVALGAVMLALAVVAASLAVMVMMSEGVDLLIAEHHAGRGLHALHQAGIKKILILVGLDERISHAARAGLEENTVFIQRILGEHIRVVEGDQDRHILLHARSLGHCNAHDSEQHNDS